MSAILQHTCTVKKWDDQNVSNHVHILFHEKKSSHSFTILGVLSKKKNCHVSFHYRNIRENRKYSDAICVFLIELFQNAY